MKKYEGYALITGGSSGLGREFANQLAKQGYDLVLVARDKAKLESEAAKIKKAYSVDVLPLALDLIKPESTDIIFNALKKKKIHVGLLVNNAGIIKERQRFHEYDLEAQLDMIRLNCLSATHLSYKFLPPMLEKGSGGIIFVSSLAGHLRTTPLIAVYGAVKSYLLKFGASLHTEYESKGIDILTICPGIINTPFLGEGGASRFNFPLLTAKEVVEISLKGLGVKSVILIKNNEIVQKIAVFLDKFLPEKTSEKLTKKYVKDTFKVDL